MDKLDVKETKEILIAAVALTKVIREYAKDGLDLSDGMAFVSKLFSDEVFRGKLVEAGKGADKAEAIARPILEQVQDIVGFVRSR